jgi:PAS domain S-box-containing protein
MPVAAISIDTPAAPKQSIAARTLRKIAIRISLVVAVATALSYWHIRTGFEQQARDNLERYVEQRRERESAVFNLASGNVRAFAEAYGRELQQADPREAERRFATLFETRPDGTTRLTEDVYRTYGVTGYIGKFVLADRDLKRRLVTAFDIVAQLGPAWASQFPNLYVVTREGAVIMYWPGKPWALESSDWEISGKLSLLSDDRDRVVVAGAEVPQAAGAAPQQQSGNGSERWSELYFDYGAGDWLVSVTRPVAGAAAPLLRVGQDILMHDLIGRAIASDMKGTYTILFSDAGRLIAHPRFMEAIQARSGALPISEIRDPHLEQIQTLARTATGRAVANEPHDEIVAMSKIDGPGWTLATVFPLSIAAESAWEAARIVLVMGALALLIEILILSSTLKAQIGTPLRQLTRAAGSVAAGRFAPPLDVRRDDEIGELADAFTTMARQIDAREKALNERSASLAQLNEQLAHELTERERAERELAHHRELNALLDTIDYGILFLDAALTVRIANAAYREMWGVADAMAAGTPIRSIKACPGHDQGAIDAEVERICRDDALDEIQRPDGRILRRHSVQLPDGGRMLTYLDITDQRRALQAIEAAEQRQRRLLELAPFPLAVTRLSDGMVLYANARLEEITGVAAEQARGTFALDFYANPDDRRRIVDLLRRDGRVKDVEVLMRQSTGGRRFWALINAAVADYEGEPALLSAFNNITAMKQREEQLEAAKRETEGALRDLHAVLDTIQYGVLFLDRDLKIRLANQAYRQLWNMPAAFYDHPRELDEDMEESRTRGLHDVADADWQAYKERRVAEIRRGSIGPIEMRLRNGRIVQYRCTVLPDGGRMLTYLDITPMKRIEEALRHAKGHAEQASRAKSQFLANMSHELRTPLNAVLGYSELLTDGIYGALPEKAYEVLGRVQANGRHLLALINDVLDLSKIEAGELSLVREPYSVDAVVKATMSAAEALANAKGLRLRCTVPDDLPPGLGDERRLTQVLLNLVGNAIKFTEAGSVEISAGVEGGRLRIAVADTGVGIAPGEQERIFGAFQQGSSAAPHGRGGTGLGLAISRRIVELHGGSIQLRSALGEGSVFTIELPVAEGSLTEAA